jgi:hypothetical protein
VPVPAPPAECSPQLAATHRDFADPLGPSPELGSACRTPGLLIGRDESGADVGVEHPRDLPHVIVRRQTRSGKSIWLYSLLAQSARWPDVEITGVDPSGITLRRVVLDEYPVVLRALDGLKTRDRDPGKTTRTLIQVARRSTQSRLPGGDRLPAGRSGDHRCC